MASHPDRVPYIFTDHFNHAYISVSPTKNKRLYLSKVSLMPSFLVKFSKEEPRKTVLIIERPTYPGFYLTLKGKK